MKLLTTFDIETKILCHDNVRELIDLIRQMQKEATIFKACVANLVDHAHGSVYDGRDEKHREGLIKELAEKFQVTPAMAEVMLDVTNETSENCAFGVI